MLLTKHHGLGNDFLVVLGHRNLGVIVGAEQARELCDRRRGIGADGLILFDAGTDPGSAGSESAEVDGVMTLFNSDGSRAEMSGNGIRCLAHAICHDRGAREANLVVDTDAGRRHLQVSPDADPRTLQVRVDMGPVREGPVWQASAAAALVVGERRVATADIGNPHVVIAVEDPWRVDLAVAGPAVEADFPEGINVHFIAPTPGRSDALDLAVWERGAGITEACGTGASAAAAIAHRWGIVGDRVEVTMPGGVVTVEVTPTSTILTGPSVFIASIDTASIDTASIDTASDEVRRG